MPNWDWANPQIYYNIYYFNNIKIITNLIKIIIKIYFYKIKLKLYKLIFI